MVRTKKYTPPKNPHKERANQLCADVVKRKAEINMNWGEYRFPNLIDGDLKNRLEIMENKFNECRAGVNYLTIIQNAEGMLRGLDKCEQNAKDRGHIELDGYIWSFYYKRTDTKFLIVCDDAYYAKAVAMSRNENPEPVVISLIEIFRLIPPDHWVFMMKIKKELGGRVIEPTSQEEIDNMGPVSSFTV